ncbi:MAG: hypothetical protein F6K25_23690 [Okeania sp. SIO2G4]|uniref:hypothetical protein n=1 Tax=unclassified Okeania TaxID=2634635 RepID=UPI0013BBBC75|nr:MULTISPECIES: hypothetical protein [unclassified Okeania]NEP40927.1 hypothetical protein [Okeania sp. SIO2H7]NEP74741.1 hypothetical protein [Okeania sp. SIO2G5]NEP95766.1 hypothetical protein [Okeania sp. SIO2F5]NEQ93501.1 hypothetical protein [Okeania sp. SIO2G4]
MAGFASLLTAAKGFKSVQIAAKIGKGLWTTVEIADAGMDVYMLGNQIAKAAGVTNPEIKDLINQVTEKGVEYDTIMKEVTQANTDITNLLAAITSLYGISADFEERQGLAFEQSQALDTLNTQLNSSIPTTYTWFENTALPDGSLSTETQQKVEGIQEQLGPDYLHIGLASTGLGLRAMFLGYSLYKKRKSGQDVPSLERQKPVIFDGVNVEELRNFSAQEKTKWQKVQSGITRYGTMMLKGVDKLVTAGSFGFNIYILIEQKKAENEMKSSLNEMLQRYESEITTYNLVLNGCKNQDGSVNEDALNDVAEVFDIDLAAESEEAKETLATGYQGIISEYDESIDGLVDGMDAAYESMIEQFKNAEIDSEDSQVIANLETSYTEFQTLKDDGKNENLASDQRKETLDKIRDEFSNSVAQQMKEINQELTSAIADHKSLSILEPYAQGIIDDANDFGLPFPLPDRYMERKATETKTTLDITYPDRERLKTVDEILEGLKTLIAELQETSPAVA